MAHERIPAWTDLPETPTTIVDGQVVTGDPSGNLVFAAGGGGGGSDFETVPISASLDATALLHHGKALIGSASGIIITFDSADWAHDEWVELMPIGLYSFWIHCASGDTMDGEVDGRFLTAQGGNVALRVTFNSTHGFIVTGHGTHYAPL